MPHQKVLLTGATVAYGSRQRPTAGLAILISGGMIAAVASAVTLRNDHPDAAAIDLPGDTILPGLTDAHGHLYGLGLSLETVDLSGAASYEEVIERVRIRAASTRPGDWIPGRSWDQNLWSPAELPSAGALDATVPDHPVWLRRVDGHAAIANSRALFAARIDNTTADPSGGRIVRDHSGRATGLLIDTAMSLVDDVIPKPSHEVRKGRVLAAVQAVAAAGLTEVHDAGTDGPTIRAIEELIAERRFPIRAYGMLAGDIAHQPLLDDWFARGPVADASGRLTVRSVKLYADGALGSRGAALLEPYSDDPGNMGLRLESSERIVSMVHAGRVAGFQINTHAIGDRAVRDVLDAYELAGVTAAERCRIEHFQIARTSDRERLARMGIIASMQPSHATSDSHWAALRLGGRAVNAYAWRDVLEGGGRLAFGSDFPVESANPFHGIYAAVTRKPPGGTAAWYPEQRVTLSEALAGYTTGAAFAAFEDTSRGVIEPGKMADLTVVEGDFFAAPESELFRHRVRLTMVGGETVYRSEGARSPF